MQGLDKGGPGHPVRKIAPARPAWRGAAAQDAPESSRGADAVEPRGEIGPEGVVDRVPESSAGGPKREVPRGEFKHTREGHVGSGHGPNRGN